MGSGASNYWLASKPSKTLDEAVGNICCAGEEVGVDINFSNPLDISLVASDVRLLCELEPSAASSSQDKSGAAGKKFELRRQDLTLRSKQKITVRLLVRRPCPVSFTPLPTLPVTFFLAHRPCLLVSRCCVGRGSAHHFDERVAEGPPTTPVSLPPMGPPSLCPAPPPPPHTHTHSTTDARKGTSSELPPRSIAISSPSPR